AGVYPHPNALGPISAICIILCFAYRPRFKVIWITASGVALWASDSRTSIIILPIALLAMMIDRRKLPAIFRNASLLLGASAVILVLFTTSFATSTIESSDTQTLNGRTQLWSDAIAQWSDSPIVGSGPNSFDVSYRLQTGRDYAGQAHNQFLQTLASEGSLGLLALCFFLYFVAKNGFRSRTNTSSASIAVGIIVLATLLVESPLRATRWSPGLLVLSVVLILCFAQDPPQVSSETLTLSQSL
ncbi:MAG: O-antigen ligase family protein, partial [Verrucomicrobiaceae bacterium]